VQHAGDGFCNPRQSTVVHHRCTGTGNQQKRHSLDDHDLLI
jgi:hypothetical protein